MSQHFMVPDDARALRDVYACFPSGVTALCALLDGVPVGIAASSFTTVSIAPPLVSVCIQRNSTTWPLLQVAPRIGVSVLGELHGKVCRQLAAKTGDRFEGTDWFAASEGSIFIRNSPVLLDCSIYRSYEGGDHELVLLEVHGTRVESELAPLIFHGSRFRRLDAA